MAGSIGWIATVTERWPADGAIALASISRLAWPSPVEIAVTCVPLGPSGTEPLAPEGGRLPDDNSGGGLTQRYGGGGASPSSSGRRANGLRCPPSAPAARYASTTSTPEPTASRPARGRPPRVRPATSRPGRRWPGLRFEGVMA